MSIAIENIVVPGPHGDVPLRTYTPRTPSGEALLWIHGGGFVKGDLDMPEADTVSRELADAGITVASVHYRLAIGGVRFPVPGDDVDAAWRWASAGGTLGIAAPRWHLGGASAGGNLAAAAALRAHDTGLPAPASLVMVYPVLHDLLPAPSPRLAEQLARLPAEARFPRERCIELNLNYVGDPALVKHPYAFPTHGRLAGLPPTLIVNAEVDDLRPSGEHFAAQLACAGVDVAVVREPGTQHAYLNYPQPATTRTIARLADWVVGNALRTARHADDAAPV